MKRILKANFVNASNFGDCVFPYMLNKWKIPYVWAHHHEEFKIISTGSIAGIGAKPNTRVWGSGIIEKNTKLEPRAIYDLVRGKYTEQNTNYSDLPWGDPAIALPHFYVPNSTAKQYDIGIIPHQIHFTKIANEIKEKNLEYKIIDPSTSHGLKFEKYIDEVVSCKKIISTTLHGLIVAHAYEIPAIPLHYDDSLVGDGIKFADYYSVWKHDSPESPMFYGKLEQAEKQNSYWKPDKNLINNVIETILNTCPLNDTKFMEDDRYFIIQT